MPDPVAWNMIERGWKVVDANGAEIGKVEEVTGDENADIFDGLAISGGKYIPSEEVGEIVEGEIRLKTAASHLQDFNEPAPQEEILPESAPWYRRLFSSRR
jgi:sporulation protein YlmC with PRC-barrel domain